MALLSWQPINFDRWSAFAAACHAAGRNPSANLADAILRLDLCWNRLREDLTRLFISSGPEGTHAHHHYHAPPDPEERDRVLAACTLDYESALLFLDVALTLSVKCVDLVSGTHYREWKRLVVAAEHDEVGLPTNAKPEILYLQRTVLYARNFAIAHPGDLVSAMSFDNVGNVTFRRWALRPDNSFVARADELLHRVMPGIRPDAHVGGEIEPQLALTWIGAQSHSLNEEDRRLFEQLRIKLGYWLPTPAEISPYVDQMVEQFVAVVPGSPFNRIALAGVQRPPAAPPPAATAPVQVQDPERFRQLIAAGITAGEDGRHEEAYGFFSQARALDNESGEAHGLLGQALLALGKPADALDHFYKAFAIDVPLAVLRRDLVRAHFNVGAESFNSGDYGRAAASYRLVCELQPNDVQARRDLATALAQSDRLEQALVVAAELVRDHPDDPEALLDVARVLTSAGQLELAQEMSERAAELAVPRTPE